MALEAPPPLVVTAQPAQFPVWAFLDAVHAVENPNDVRTPGAHGELGPYQFKRETWRSLTPLPFDADHACDPEIAQSVAVKELGHIMSRLAVKRIPLTPENVALCWRRGIAGALSGAPDPAAAEYAKRVARLTQEGVK